MEDIAKNVNNKMWPGVGRATTDRTIFLFLLLHCRNLIFFTLAVPKFDEYTVGNKRMKIKTLKSEKVGTYLVLALGP